MEVLFWKAILPMVGMALKIVKKSLIAVDLWEKKRWFLSSSRMVMFAPSLVFVGFLKMRNLEFMRVF